MNLELHGIDVLDADDGLEALARTSPTCASRASARSAALRAVVDELRAAGYTFVTMSEAARRLTTSPLE